MKVPTLSSVFTPAAISGMTWKLQGPDACPPLYFDSLENLSDIRTKSSTNDSCRTLSSTGVLQHISELARIDNIQDEKSYFQRIALALLLLGYGYTDECHNLVTPLSWPEDIHFAHGPSIYQYASPAVRAYASYTHSLVHRKEALNVGEFGLVGFANAKFWSNAVDRSGEDGVNRLPHDEWKQAITQLAQTNSLFQTNVNVQSWCKQHGFVPSRKDNETKFDSRIMHQLCATILQQKEDSADPVFRSFAEQAVAQEVKILLQSSLKHGEFEEIPNGEDDITEKS